MFSDVSVRDMLVRMGMSAGSDYAREHIAWAVLNITAGNADGKRMFSDVSVRDMLVHMGMSAGSDSARHRIAWAIVNITL